MNTITRAATAGALIATAALAFSPATADARTTTDACHRSTIDPHVNTCAKYYQPRSATYRPTSWWGVGVTYDMNVFTSYGYTYCVGTPPVTHPEGTLHVTGAAVRDHLSANVAKHELTHWLACRIGWDAQREQLAEAGEMLQGGTSTTNSGIQDADWGNAKALLDYYIGF